MWRVTSCVHMYYLYSTSSSLGIPPDSETSTEYSECEYYLLPYDNLTDDDIWNWDWNSGEYNRSSTPVDECDSWVFDKSEFTKTAVSEVSMYNKWEILMYGRQFLIYFYSTNLFATAKFLSRFHPPFICSVSWSELPYPDFYRTSKIRTMSCCSNV